MHLGIFAKTFSRPGFRESFTAARAHGLTCIQFNFSCAGLPTLPDSFDAALTQNIRAELEAQSLSMSAVSGTCNLIHPDALKRQSDLGKLERLIHVCPGISTQVVTLCTGTRDPSDMWRAHPDNHSTDAWKDLIQSLERLLPVAQDCNIFLGIEPEPANVIDSAATARKLLDELKSPWLKIVFDAANLLKPQELNQQERVLGSAVDSLGPDIVIAHAKDVMPAEPLRHVAAGTGALDYVLYLRLLNTAGFDGALILHSLMEHEVPASVAFLEQRLRASRNPTEPYRNALSQPGQH